MNQQQAVRYAELVGVAVVVLVVFTAARRANADTVDFRSGGSSASLSISPTVPTRLDVVSFSMPLDGRTHGNGCDAASVLGGFLTIQRDDPNGAIQLEHDGNVPLACTLIYDPVNGAEGQVGPLDPGVWVLSDSHGNTLEFSVAALCDFDADGQCDSEDINLLYGVGDIQQGVSVTQADPIFDLNGDGQISLLDRDEWLASAATENGLSSPYFLGDANLDGAVNAEDLNVVGVNWQQDEKRWTTGDFTGDGRVDASDLNFVGLNWQRSIPALAATATNAVPEPSGFCLLVVAGLMICRRVR